MNWRPRFHLNKKDIIHYYLDAEDGRYIIFQDKMTTEWVLEYRGMEIARKWTKQEVKDWYERTK